MSACKSCLGTGVLWKKPSQAAFVRCVNCNKFADDEHFLKAIQALLQAQNTPAAPPAEPLFRKLLSRFMDFDGGPHWTEDDFALVDKCWAHFRNTNQGETETPKPTPPPASPLKFGSLKEMGEHIARLAAAFKDSASEFEEFSGWEWRWCPMSSVLCGAMERPSHYRLKPAPVKPREWWGVFVGLNELMEITPIRAEAIRFSQARLGSALRLLIEWPEGAELPDLPEAAHRR